MKKLFFLPALFLIKYTFCQTTVLNPPIYFIDSIRVHSLGILDPNKIESINVIKNDPAAPTGKIYIKTKDPGSLHFLTAGEVIRKYNFPADGITIFFLDNEIIKDTSAFRIDSSYILNVEIIKASEIQYLPRNIPGLRILKIITATKENMEKQNIIRIRGNYTPG